MSKFILRLNSQPFEAIKAGTKTIEMRLHDEKRKQYKVGDILIFKKRPEEIDSITVEIIALHNYNSFAELYKNFDKVSLGYNKNEQANPEDMNEFYPNSEQEKYGVIGIEIKLLKNIENF